MFVYPIIMHSVSYAQRHMASRFVVYIREDACSRTAYFIRHTAYGIVPYVRHNNHAGSPVLGIPALPH